MAYINETIQWKIQWKNLNREWMRTNEEIQKMYEMADMRWLEHIRRMDDSRLTKKIINKTIDEKRKEEDVRMRWRSDVEINLNKLNLENWKNQMINRKEPTKLWAYQACMTNVLLLLAFGFIKRGLILFVKGYMAVQNRILE